MGHTLELTMDQTYSIKEMIDELRKDVNARFDKVDEAQAHTNGDVGALKLRNAFLSGGLVVIALIVIPLIVYVWNQAQDNRSKLETISNQQQFYGESNNNKTGIK